MTISPSIRSVGVCAVVCVTLVAMQAQHQDAAGGPSAGQGASPGAGSRVAAASAGAAAPTRQRSVPGT